MRNWGIGTTTPRALKGTSERRDQSLTTVLTGKRRRGQRRGAAGDGRRRYDHIGVRIVVGDLGEHEGCWGCSGKAYEPIAADEMQSEIRWRVVVYRIGRRRRRYRRSFESESSSAVIVAPRPAKVIPKVLFSAAAIASVLVEKFTPHVRSTRSSPRCRCTAWRCRREAWRGWPPR